MRFFLPNFNNNFFKFKFLKLKVYFKGTVFQFLDETSGRDLVSKTSGRILQRKNSLMEPLITAIFKL